MYCPEHIIFRTICSKFYQNWPSFVDVTNTILCVFFHSQFKLLLTHILQQLKCSITLTVNLTCSIPQTATVSCQSLCQCLTMTGAFLTHSEHSQVLAELQIHTDLYLLYNTCISPTYTTVSK